MNRSFMDRDLRMRMQDVAGRQRQQLLASLKEKEEELDLFLEMKKREKDQHNLLLNNVEEFDVPPGSKAGTSAIFNISSSIPARKTSTDDFLNSDNDKNDYEWLLTPPATPLFPSLDAESQKPTASQISTPMIRTRLASPKVQASPRCGLAPRNPTPSRGFNPPATALRRLPASSSSSLSTCSAPRSRPATPTKRSPSIPSKPIRSSTPTPRPTILVPPSVKNHHPTAPSRSSTPSRAVRSSTPTRHPHPSSCPPTARTSCPAPSRGPPPSVRSSPWKPSEMPGFSNDAPPNLRTSLPDRPLSSSRGRPCAPASNPILTRHSCSPARGRTASSATNLTRTSPNRLNPNAPDRVSPVAIGSKMVDRLVNMRKLPPTKSPSSPDTLGFGRSLSKKSLDMAIRHMDIRRSMPGNLRSICNSRSGSTKARALSVSDSPMATSSSNASSELSFPNNNNCLSLDGTDSELDALHKRNRKSYKISKITDVGSCRYVAKKSNING